MELIRPLTIIFWSFVSIFLTCDFGERVSNRFDVIDDVLCQFEWYDLPLEVQKMLPIIMMSTQQTVVFKGFGNILLLREVFRQVSAKTSQMLIGT